MARIPDADIERLKQEISLQRLVEAQGIELKRHGADLLGLCPFHDDREPSLVISPKKNLWHCLGACQGRRVGNRLGDAQPRRQLPSCGRTVAQRASVALRAGARRLQGDHRRGEAGDAVRDQHRRSARVAPGGRLLPRNAEAKSRSAALSGRPRPHASGDDRALQAGLCQPYARLQPPGNRKVGAEIRGRLQREAQTLEGLLAQQERDDILKVHQNAQRLLKPLAVVNPSARKLTFPGQPHAHAPRSHQAPAADQRHRAVVPVSAARKDRYAERPECFLHRGAKEDIRVANRLAHEVLGRSLDELPPQTRRLLILIEESVRRECERLKMERSDFRFSRRDVRTLSRGGPDDEAGRHADRVVGLQ